MLIPKRTPPISIRFKIGTKEGEELSDLRM